MFPNQDGNHPGPLSRDRQAITEAVHQVNTQEASINQC